MLGHHDLVRVRPWDKSGSDSIERLVGMRQIAAGTTALLAVYQFSGATTLVRMRI